MSVLGRVGRKGYPSGWARATRAGPMLPLAPGLLSMMTCWPVVWVTDWAKARAMPSVRPPAGKFTTIVIGLVGHVPWARTMAGATMARPAVARSRVRLVVVL